MQYERAVLGDAMGYLPQDVELLDGTVAENIARFGEIDADAVVRAAQCAGVHEMILALPAGYETRLDGHGNLSAGQRQRVALARALYRDPKVVILDEPNSNLDEAGNAALERTLAALRSTRTTVIIVTHRSRVLTQLDAVLLLIDGKLSHYGTPEQVAAELKRRAVGPTPSATDVRVPRAVA
jgi:ABC-type protease/lipase transport system fused ATPase/permease subunit